MQVLQLCHGYDGPFLDCARQYAALFHGTPHRVTTVYLTGAPNAEVARETACDQVIFLDFSSAALRGLKLRAIAALRRAVDVNAFAFCIAHRAKPTYVALLATRLPVISVNHALGNFRRWQRRAFAHGFRKRLAILGVSDAVRDDIRASLRRWQPERIQTLYNRVDVDALQAGLLTMADARQQLGLPEHGWVVGNVGRLHPDKDQATLIKGFARALPALPAGSVLAIVGSGRLEQALRQLAATLGVAQQVVLLGQVPHARRYLRAFNVFVLSSGPEACPMAVIEAMAAGVALVATDCGGAPELVRGIGRLFPPRDEQALAAALVTMAADADSADAWQSPMAARLHALFSDQAARGRFWDQLLTALVAQRQ